MAALYVPSANFDQEILLKLSQAKDDDVIVVDTYPFMSLARKMQRDYFRGLRVFMRVEESSET